MSQSYPSISIHIEILQDNLWGESCKNGEDNSSHRAKAQPELLMLKIWKNWNLKLRTPVWVDCESDMLEVKVLEHLAAVEGGKDVLNDAFLDFKLYQFQILGNILVFNVDCLIKQMQHEYNIKNLIMETELDF